MCDVYDENLVKATLPGSGRTYHHDAINLQIHKIAQHACMTSDMEIEDYFMRKLNESAILNNNGSLPLLSKHLNKE